MFYAVTCKNRKYFGEWLNVIWDDNISINLLGTDLYMRIDVEKRNRYRIMKSNAEKNIKLKGVGSALIVFNTEELLDKIAKVEEDYHLPHGVKSKRDEKTKLSYYCISNVKLYKHLGQEEYIKDNKDGSITLPVSNRRYLKISNIKKGVIIDSFSNAEIID